MLAYEVQLIFSFSFCEAPEGLAGWADNSSQMSLGLKPWITIAGLSAFALFRRRWWKRCHYHTLLGRILSFEEMVEVHCGLLDEIERVFAAHEVTWWMDAGTLLGAWRDGSYIPWDDDIDIAVMHTDHQRILDLPFDSRYRMVEVSKFWSVDKIIPGLARVWPSRTYLRLLDPSTQLYVDIFEVAQNEDVLEFLPLSLMHRPLDPQGRPFAVSPEVLFPLGRLPFEGRLWPAPARPKEYLQAYLGEDLDPDHTWKNGRWVPDQPPGWRI